MAAETTAPAVCGTENLIAGKAPTATQDVSGHTALVTDETIAAEGSEWDGPAALTLQTGTGFLTYDLGAPREIGAIYLQADANDTYRVTGSIDDKPDSYRLLAEIDNVVGTRGGGLRARWLTAPPMKVRYIRVGEGSGDAF